MRGSHPALLECGAITGVDTDVMARTRCTVTPLDHRGPHWRYVEPIACDCKTFCRESAHAFMPAYETDERGQPPAIELVRTAILKQPRLDEVINGYYPNLTTLARESGFTFEELYAAWKDLDTWMGEMIEAYGLIRRIS